MLKKLLWKYYYVDFFLSTVILQISSWILSQKTRFIFMTSLSTNQTMTGIFLTGQLVCTACLWKANNVLINWMTLGMVSQWWVIYKVIWLMWMSLYQYCQLPKWPVSMSHQMSVIKLLTPLGTVIHENCLTCDLHISQRYWLCVLVNWMTHTTNTGHGRSMVGHLQCYCDSH